MMQSFEEVEQLLADLEAAEISQEEAVKRIDAARALLACLYNKLGNIAAAIARDPQRWKQTAGEG